MNEKYLHMNKDRIKIKKTVKFMDRLIKVHAEKLTWLSRISSIKK